MEHTRAYAVALACRTRTRLRHSQESIMRLRHTCTKASVLLSGALLASAAVAQSTSPSTSNTQATGPTSGAQQRGCEGMTGTSRTDCENRMRGAGNTQGNTSDSSSMGSAGQADSNSSMTNPSDTRTPGASTSDRTRISRGDAGTGTRGSTSSETSSATG